MKHLGIVFGLAAGLCCITAAFGTEHFVSPAGGNVSPFLSWDAAATNIQDAIDAAAGGDVVWVTNGTYSSGGKVMAGDLTNRVVLDKALTVQSVNGPSVTTIQGAWDPATIVGPLALRCAWLTNNAVLKGFTICRGSTRSSGLANDLRSGGGVWCASASSVVANCIIRSNAAYSLGGGSFRGFLQNCALVANRMPTMASWGSAACSNAVLVNCTIVSNWPGIALVSATLTNCIVYSNASGNYLSSTLAYSCTTPLPPGSGNISADPQVLSDGFHLASTSPCIAAGLAQGVGTDIDGQSWGTPPSIGCDEWYPAPLPLAAPVLQLTNYPVGFSFTASVAGQEPFVCWWTRNGTPLEDDGHYLSSHATNLMAMGLRSYDGGYYQVTISNAFGIATTPATQLIVHCVDAASTNPVPPYLDWSTAANNIQDAVDAAANGEFVLVTNAVYSTGGRVMAGDLTNRLVLAKPVNVLSVNGPAVTVIQGAWDPVSTNGPLAVRCVWMTNGASLNGFTLQGGATRNTGDILSLQSGGGLWAISETNCLVANCVLSTNAAACGGGGCSWGLVLNSRILGNTSQYGGGAQYARLANCLLMGNSASIVGGGAYYSGISNCTVTANYAAGGGGGVTSPTTAQNSIVYGNSWGQFHLTSQSQSDWSGYANMNYCCTQPGPVGISNIISSPQFALDGFHLSATSPCRGRGSSLYVSGTDLDGEPWVNPPSIGCDEYYPADFTGPLSVGAISATNILSPGPVLRNASAWVRCSITGNADRLLWSFGDGTVLSNAFYLSPSHTWTNAGDFNVTFTAFNADNPSGVATNALIHVSLPASPPVSVIATNGTNLVLTFPTQNGITYYIEQATNIQPPVAWQSIGRIFNTGLAAQMSITPTNQLGFFRVRVQ